MTTNLYDIVVIGGGCVGLSTAYKINQKYPDLKIAVLEKESQVSAHQTGRNSGVIHSGIYYKPGSYKAKNCVTGRRELVAFAKEYNIKHDICGKIIVASKEEELAHMNKVFQNGIANGIEDIRMISAKEITEIEPYCEGIAGIWVGCTGIIDYVGFTKKLAELIESKFTGSKVFLETEVKDFIKDGPITTVKTNRGDFTAKNVIACAGLQSDRIAIKEGTGTDSAIVGFRGDYYDLSEKGKNKVRNLIYPVPNPQFPFLGVHFTRMTNGSVECGPNAVFVFKREGYNKTDFNLKDTVQALGYKGTRRFFAKHWRFGLDEYRGAFSKAYFLKRLQKLIPSLQSDDIVPGRAGVRAMALSREGNMIDDFKIEAKGNAIHVLNAPSPAATAALAIGAAIEEIATKQFNLG
ncbi:hydroxyglutarate oxidase [Niastella yeongjuensis]|uniref:Hydroxyglutarate oxidase n=1 Tax=Niastella yeongjuensis TaxID=354355 RepID=A0A1V9E1V6_9BACT|nr:L-2-hydroxyglutarate oxidase [Niastella yeongjuensis]OQP40090.1 hydroxyglutarate oxidase [Niastella yeongjuensis]SEO05420.1 L-2-hydroxyglutarate oxidase [Niastella yeongjuensis]